MYKKKGRGIMAELPKVHLTIDNKEVEVPKGATILQAARQANIDIPSTSVIHILQSPIALISFK